MKIFIYKIEKPIRVLSLNNFDINELKKIGESVKKQQHQEQEQQRGTDEFTPEQKSKIVDVLIAHKHLFA